MTRKLSAPAPKYFINVHNGLYIEHGKEAKQNSTHQYGREAHEDGLAEVGAAGEELAHLRGGEPAPGARQVSQDASRLHDAGHQQVREGRQEAGLGK